MRVAWVRWGLDGQGWAGGRGGLVGISNRYLVWEYEMVLLIQFGPWSSDPEAFLRQTLVLGGAGLSNHLLRR